MHEGTRIKTVKETKKKRKRRGKEGENRVEVTSPHLITQKGSQISPSSSCSTPRLALLSSALEDIKGNTFAASRSLLHRTV